MKKISADVDINENAPEDELAQFHDKNRYAVLNKRTHTKKLNRKLIALILFFAMISVAAGGYIVYLFNGDHFVSAAEAPKYSWGASDEDVKMLDAEGYDALALTENTKAFLEGFLTFDKASVDEGTWKSSFEEYINIDGIVDIEENLLYKRLQKSWLDEFEDHPYYKGKLLEAESLSWSVLPTQTVNVPYCDVYATVERTPIDVFFINSPFLMLNRYLDRYRIVFDENGKITSIKRTYSKLLDENIDEAAAEGDLSHISKMLETEKKKAEKAAKEDAVAQAEAKKKADEAARARAEEEARQQEEAEKRAEEAVRKAIEAEKKKQEEQAAAANKNENAASNANNSSNSNINVAPPGNSNTNSAPPAGNENAPSNSNANENSENTGNESAQSAE